MEKTLFQRIIDREIPATIEYEDDNIIAIRDIAPSAETHILIIPKRVIESANNIQPTDAEVLAQVFSVAQQLAKKNGIADSGYRIVTNVNADAGQTIFHLHFHLLGGEPLGRMNSSGRTHSTSSSRSGMLRDAGLVIIAAIGLAIGFNMMNPKSIDWLKKEFEHTTIEDSSLAKYLGENSGNREIENSTTTATTTTSTTTTSTTPTSTPNAATEVEKSSQLEKPVAEVGKPAVQKPAPKFVAEPGVVREITKSQFVALMNAGPYYLIDARLPETYAKGYIKDAHNIYGAEAEANIPTILETVPRDRVILIYCDGGECELSHHVADVLKNFSYGPIFIFTGGWAEWKK